MKQLNHNASLSTINTTKHIVLSEETYIQHFSNNQKFYSVNMQHSAIATKSLATMTLGTMASLLMGCGGGSSSGSSAIPSDSPSVILPSPPAGDLSGVLDEPLNPSLDGSSSVPSNPPSNDSNTTTSPTENTMDTTVLSDIDAARFLQQAQFSSTRAEIDYVKSVGGIDAWLTGQFSMRVGVTGYNWLFQQGYHTQKYHHSIAPVDRMIWQQLLSSKDTLRKRVALAFSEIMVISSLGLSVPCTSFAVAAYWDVLNRHAFGNFRSLLKAVILNLGMGDFLSLRFSKKADSSGRRPDENFAREMMQLFTIGTAQLNLDGTKKLYAGKPIETYNQETVSNVAQALTGWGPDISYDTNSPTNPQFTRVPMVNSADMHDTRSASFFGVTIPSGTSGEQALEIVVNTLYKHPNVAPFICKQLIQRLVTSNPSPQYVKRVATIFNRNSAGKRGDLQSVLRAIFTDPEARTPPVKNSPTAGKVREPLIRFIQWVHTFTNRQSISGGWQIQHSESSIWHLNQGALRSPSVFNFFSADYAPTSTPFINNKLVAPELQLHTETSTVSYINYIRYVIENGVPNLNDNSILELAPNYAEVMSLYNQPEKLVAHLNLILCAGQMSDKTILLITNTLKEIKPNLPNWEKNRILFAVLMTFISPDYLVQK